MATVTGNRNVGIRQYTSENKYLTLTTNEKYAKASGRLVRIPLMDEHKSLKARRDRQC